MSWLFPSPPRTNVEFFPLPLDRDLFIQFQISLECGVILESGRNGEGSTQALTHSTLARQNHSSASFVAQGKMDTTNRMRGASEKELSLVTRFYRLDLRTHSCHVQSLWDHFLSFAIVIALKPHTPFPALLTCWYRAVLCSGCLWVREDLGFWYCGNSNWY